MSAYTQRLVGAVTVLLLALGFSLFGGTSAIAESPPAIAVTPVAWQPNGCTFSPDRTADGVNFKPACDQHDKCYHYHWAGDDFNGFATCNNWFENDMLRACNGKSGCRATAYWYSGWVKTYGWPFFLCRACR
ncbi:phospholipase A2 [Nocardia suismassiliense]|uniref:phospholipase A2 n=1 Tax=Nocardia suismassiliense TaxID=2077092 RepID=UPI003898F0AA